jgi:hypothetical protein
MGGSHSSVKSSITNNTINTTDISNTTKNIQESATNTLVENASSCSSSVDQTNSCNLSGAQIAGNFNLGGTQTNKASVNFSCVQSSSAANSMADAMSSSIANELGVLNGSEAANKMNAAAAAATKSGFGSWGGGSSKADTDTNVSNNVTNQTKMAVENIFKKNLSNNFSSKTVDECIGRTKQTNSIEAVGVKVGGNANVECNQSNSLEQVSECKQLTEAINKTISQTAQELGLKVEAVSKTATKTESTSKATTETVSTGPIQDLGNAISGLLGLASLGVAAPFIAYCSIICCCLIISLISSAVLMKSGGGSSGAPAGFSMPRGMPKGLGKFGRFKGGNSETDNSSDIIEYLGSTSIDLISDVLTDKSPLFE